MGNETASPVNISETLKRFMGNRELIRSLYSELEKSIESHIRVIDAAYNSGNLETIAYQAHLLRGAAANMSIPGIMDKASVLEQMGNKQMAITRKAIEDLQAEVERFITFIRQLDWEQI